MEFQNLTVILTGDITVMNLRWRRNYDDVSSIYQRNASEHQLRKKSVVIEVMSRMYPRYAQDKTHAYIHAYAYINTYACIHTYA